MNIRSLRSVRSWLTLLAVMAGMLAIAPATAYSPPTFSGGPTNFITMSDGTSIAVNVVYPASYNPNIPGAIKYPTIFEMAGYENGSSSATGRTMTGELYDWFESQSGRSGDPEPPLANDTHEGTSAYRYDGDYVSVHASVRGTGCSAGEFDLFSSRTALDGYEIIEDWIVKQPWSNEKVGILGHSYSGITGFRVAATQPPHLTAITVSGLLDDLYRGITFPGGVSNGGFPVLWTLGVRPAYDVLGGTVQGMARHGTDAIAQQCAKNVATHRRTVLNDPIVQGINDQDNDWWRSRSLITYAHLINRPIHISGAFQDEQTGPRGFAHLWEAIQGTPKRLIMSNGNHGTQVGNQLWQDRKAWMDYWMRGITNPNVEPDDAASSVRTFLERHNGAANSSVDSTSFPYSDTTWKPFFLNDGGKLQTSDAGLNGSDSYVTAGRGREAWSFQVHDDNGITADEAVTTPDGPDELNFKSEPFGSAMTVVGPITANLFLSSTSTDTEMFVEVIDFNPADGSKTYLQRGMLKASHRAIINGKSDFFGTDPVNGGPFMYRPFRPHTNPTDIVPGAVNEYLVEVFPLGHIFRAGHQLQIKVETPPAVDSYYAYVPKTTPAVNTLFHDLLHKSRITLPVVTSPAILGPEVPCGDLEAVRCVK